MQREFTRYLRDPERASAPAGLPMQGLAVYRDAVIHNMDRFLSDNFPRVCSVIGPERWPSLVRDYFARHRSQTPVFAELPGEFLAYLRDERDDARDPPFLYELAHFEWLENALCCDEREVELTGVDRDGELASGVVVVNPIHRLETYDYPVHVADPNDIPSVRPPRPTHLVAYRARDYRYGFLDLNAVSLRLFAAVRGADGRSARDIILEIARELAHPDPDAVLRGGLDILSRMRELDLILGVRRG